MRVIIDRYSRLASLKVEENTRAFLSFLLDFEVSVSIYIELDSIWR